MTHGEEGRAVVVEGDRVVIVSDGDGPNGRRGTVLRVYRSGRVAVVIDGEPAGWRNFPRWSVRRIDDETAR